MSGGEAEKEVVIFLVGVCQVDPRLFSPRREGVEQEEKNSLCARPPAPGSTNGRWCVQKKRYKRKKSSTKSGNENLGSLGYLYKRADGGRASPKALIELDLVPVFFSNSSLPPEWLRNCSRIAHRQK